MSIDNSEAREKRGILADIACTAMDFFSIWADAISDISMDINAIPGVATKVGISTSSVSAVSHLTKAGTEMVKVALGCDDIPFEEIKDIMMAKFGNINRRLNFNNGLMENMIDVASQAFKLAEKTRMEMRRGFKVVMNEIKSVGVKEKIEQINNFAQYFSTESLRINALPTEEYVAKLEEEDGILYLLKDSRTPKIESLYSAMNDIILNGDAIPKNENDSTAFQALFALFYGAQTYVNLVGFLIKSNSFLVDYYYLNGDYAKYNDGIDTLSMIVDDFKASLLDDTSGVIPKIENVLDTVRNKGFIKKIKSSLYKQVADKTKILQIFKEQINKISLPVIDDIPLTPWMQFDEPSSSTPIAEWKEGAVVKYAAQFSHGFYLSKLSDWSDPLTIRNKAFVSVLSTEGDHRRKLIFRQFNDDQPELVYELDGEIQSFRDAFRDLYNAAGNPDTDLGLEDAKKIMNCCGSYVTAKSYEHGREIIHNLAKSDNVKLFNFLQPYDKVNRRDDKGYTPLHVAVMHGSTGMMWELIKHGANPSLKTHAEGYTPLHLAVLNGMEDIVESLIGGTNVDNNAVDKNGFTPLHLTVSSGAHLIGRLMDDDDHLNINAKSKTGLTVLHLAAIQGEYEFFNVLKNRRSLDVNAADVNNMTPLHYAALMGHDDMVGKMLSQFKNIKVNIAEKNNKWTPLHYAIFFKKTDSALKLIDHVRMNASAKASNDVAPLHMAASTGQDDLIEKLLNKKADKDAKTTEGNTPLHFAAMNDCEPCAKLLIDKGAAINAKNNKNETPLDLATKFGDGDLAKYLKSKAGKRYRKNIESIIASKFNENNKIAYTGSSCNEANCKNTLKLGMNSYMKVSKPVNLSLDGNGTLLLLDLLLRKLSTSNEKYISSLPGSVSELEAQLKALDVTEKFEKFLNLVSDVPVNEEINLVEVSSKVKKALMGGSGKEVVNVLCSYAETMKSLAPRDVENAMKNFKPEKIFINEDSLATEEVISMMTKTCTEQNAVN